MKEERSTSTTMAGHTLEKVFAGLPFNEELIMAAATLYEYYGCIPRAEALTQDLRRTGEGTRWRLVHAATKAQWDLIYTKNIQCRYSGRLVTEYEDMVRVVIPFPWDTCEYASHGKTASMIPETVSFICYANLIPFLSDAEKACRELEDSRAGLVLCCRSQGLEIPKDLARLVTGYVLGIRLRSISEAEGFGFDKEDEADEEAEDRI
jgi:hypothetical protein